MKTVPSPLVSVIYTCTEAKSKGSAHCSCDPPQSARLGEPPFLRAVSSVRVQILRKCPSAVFRGGEKG